MRKLIIIFLLFSLCYALFTGEANASVKLKAIVANPSETEAKTVPVKFYLPKEIRPEDVTDRGRFEIGYDPEKSLYYVHQELTLEPKETVTLEIGMNDVWIIPAQEIEHLRQQAEKILAALKNSEYHDQAKILTASLLCRLDAIAQKQNQSGLTVEQRVSEHSANIAVFNDVKKDIAVLEDLALEVGGTSALPASGLIGESAPIGKLVSVENITPDIEKAGTVKFQIKLSNDSTEKKITSLKYYLPIEVKPEYIVSKGELNAAYDYQKGIYYVYKDAVDLAPNEKKEFIIEVKDIWKIPGQMIGILKAHTEKLSGMLVGSAHKDFAKSLNDKIISDLDNIKVVQDNPTSSVERHIGDYRVNLAKLDEIKKDIAKLEKLVMHTGGSAGLALADRQGAGGLLRGAKGMEMVGKSIFRGKAPSVSTTWKIIWIIVGFLAMVSFLFFILWWMQIKVGAGRKKEEVNQKTENRGQKTNDRG